MLVLWQMNVGYLKERSISSTLIIISFQNHIHCFSGRKASVTIGEVKKSLETQAAAAAAAKSLQLCPTLCDPIDGHQAPLSLGFSRQDCWSGLPFPFPMHACMQSCFNRVRLCATPWTAAHQAPLSKGFSRQEYWKIGRGYLYKDFIRPLGFFSGFDGNLVFVKLMLIIIWRLKQKGVLSIKNAFSENSRETYKQHLKQAKVVFVLHS